MAGLSGAGELHEPSHRLLRQLADDPRYAPMLTEVAWPIAADAASYLGDLADLGCSVDAGDYLPGRAKRAGSGVPLDFRAPGPDRCSRCYLTIVVNSSFPIPGVAEQGLPDTPVRDGFALSANLRRGASASRAKFQFFAS